MTSFVAKPLVLVARSMANAPVEKKRGPMANAPVESVQSDPDGFEIIPLVLKSKGFSDPETHTGHSAVTMSIQEAQNERSRMRSHKPQTPRGGNPNVDPTGIIDSFTSGTIKNVDDKISFLASKRFPNEPNAAARYKVNPAGEIIYQERDKSWTLENESDETFLGMQLGDATRGLAKFAGRSGGEMLGSVAGGVAGGVSGASAGGIGALPGSIVGSSAGAAAGDAYRQLYAASQGYPDRGSADDIAKGLMGIAAVDATGGGVIGAAGKGISKIKLNRDWKNYDSGKADALTEKARELGIELTGAQATGLRSLINSEASVGMGQDEVADLLYKFLNKQKDDTASAVEGFIGKTPRGEVSGSDIRAVQQALIDDQVAARTAATKSPYNQSVREEAVVPADLIAKLMEDEVIRDAFDIANTKPLWNVMDHPDNSMTKLDAVKKIIDDQIQAAKGPTKQPGHLEQLMQRKNMLTAITDQASPGYKQARAQFVDESNYLKTLEDGIPGQLARTKDTQLVDLATKQLNKASPPQIAEMRKEFILMGKTKEWDGVVNRYLRDKWENIGETLAGDGLGNGAKFRQAMLGSKAKRLSARELLGPERYKGFTNLMDVLEATGRVPRGQSMTNAAGKADTAARREAAPLRSVAKDFINLNWLDWWIDSSVAKQKSIMLDIMTSPDSLKQLEELGKLAPLTAKQKIKQNVIGSAAFDVVGEMITSSDEMDKHLKGDK